MGKALRALLLSCRLLLGKLWLNKGGSSAAGDGFQFGQVGAWCRTVLALRKANKKKYVRNRSRALPVYMLLAQTPCAQCGQDVVLSPVRSYPQPPRPLRYAISLPLIASPRCLPGHGQADRMLSAPKNLSAPCPCGQTDADCRARHPFSLSARPS